mmetsp:Transcript_2454/g.4559  ORF Transcript_2454/g.4559 Transcript_2454/m.4559 type:complete len:420 (+) Transcript_2454:31-1290(+)
MGSAVGLRACLWLLASTGAFGLPSQDECGGVDPREWTSPAHKSAGYHVLCISNPAARCQKSGDADGQCKADEPPTATVCWSGFQEACEEMSITEALSTPEHGKRSLVGLQELLVVNLAYKKRFQALQEKREKQKKISLGFAFFSVKNDGLTPSPLTSIKDASGMVLAFEGGSFLWPGIEVGFNRTVTLPLQPEAIRLTITTRSLLPLVVEISSFIEPSECEHIIQKALPHVQRSSVKHMDHDVGKPDANWRTSSTYFMASDDDILRRLDTRVSALTLIKKSHQEHAQILRYEKGEQYVAHHDYFDVSAYANNRDIQRMTNKGLFNRLATVFFYLSDVEAGGQTNFPRAGGLPQPRNFGDCSEGVSIMPRQGRIMIFYSQFPSGKMDPDSLHGGCAVEKGTKWSANKWIWNKPMGYTRDD